MPGLPERGAYVKALFGSPASAGQGQAARNVAQPPRRLAWWAAASAQAGTLTRAGAYQRATTARTGGPTYHSDGYRK
jgi:hypothetical protein